MGCKPETDTCLSEGILGLTFCYCGIFHLSSDVLKTQKLQNELL